MADTPRCRMSDMRTGEIFHWRLFTSAKEVMFSSALVCLFVSRITAKLYSTDFHKIRCKGGTWVTEEAVRFWW